MKHPGTKWRDGVLDGVRGTAGNEKGTESVFDKRRLQPYH